MGVVDDAAVKLGGSEGQEGGFAALQKLVCENGGLRGLTSRFADSGLGHQVRSWIGIGDNQPVSGAQVQKAVDAGELHQMAQQAGLSDQETSEEVAKALPEMVSRATPQGQLPDADPFAKGLDVVKRMLKL